MVEKGCKYGFLVVVLEKTKCGMVIRNPTSEDQGSYNETIQPKNSSYDCSKCKKNHAQKVIKNEKFLGVEENIPTLILQVVEEPYLEALKEE